MLVKLTCKRMNAKSMYTKILSNLLTIASFRIGAPSILFLLKKANNFLWCQIDVWSFVTFFGLTFFWACAKQRFCFSESYSFSNQIGVPYLSIVPIMPRPKHKLHYIPYIPGIVLDSVTSVVEFCGRESQGLDFCKKISERKIIFWFDFHRWSHGS